MILLQRVLQLEGKLPLQEDSAPLTGQSKDSLDDGSQAPSDNSVPEDPHPPFHAPVTESEALQKTYSQTASNYFEERHAPHFNKRFENNKTSIEQKKLRIERQARPSNYLTLLGKAALNSAKFIVAFAMVFEFFVYYIFGVRVLEWLVLESASLAIVPLLISKFAGSLLFKEDLLKGMKNGQPFSITGKKYIIGLCIALAFGVGFSLYSSKKMKDDRLAKLADVLTKTSNNTNDFSGLYQGGFTENPDFNTAPSNDFVEIEDSPILKFLHELSTFLAIGLLGVLSFLSAGFFLTRLDIISPIVKLKLELQALNEEYCKAIARTETLILGRKEGARLAACIAGKRAILKIKTKDNNDNLFSK